jgi:hypothetical protein
VDRPNVGVTTRQAYCIKEEEEEQEEEIPQRFAVANFPNFIT